MDWEQLYLVAYFNNIDTQCYCWAWRNFSSILGIQKKKATFQLSACKCVYKHTCKVLKYKTCWEMYWLFNIIFNGSGKFWCSIPAWPIKITEQTRRLAVKKIFLSRLHFYDHQQSLSIINPHGHNRWLNWRNVLEVILLPDVLNY